MSIKSLEASAPFSAKVERIDIITNTSPAMAFVWMKTTDGKRIALGGEEEGPKMIDFAGSLSEGQTYEFPKTWLEYQQGKRKAGAQ